jgi:hypothetical protein
LIQEPEFLHNEKEELMPDGNGASRLDRIEKQIEKLGEIVTGLVEHAGLSNQRFDRLEGIVRENNERTASLVSAIRDLVNRIPPENLR